MSLSENFQALGLQPPHPSVSYAYANAYSINNSLFISIEDDSLRWMRVRLMYGLSMAGSWRVNNACVMISDHRPVRVSGGIGPSCAISAFNGPRRGMSTVQLCITSLPVSGVCLYVSINNRRSVSRRLDVFFVASCILSRRWFIDQRLNVSDDRWRGTTDIAPIRRAVASQRRVEVVLVPTFSKSSSPFTVVILQTVGSSLWSPPVNNASPSVLFSSFLVVTLRLSLTVDHIYLSYRLRR